MKNKLTILIDMDDTIEDLVCKWVELLNHRYNLSVSKDDIVDWNISTFFPTLTKDEVYSVLDEDELWANVQPKVGAVEYVKRLVDDGHNVFICTSSGYKHLRSKMDLVLFKYFPYLTWSNVIITSNKQMVRADILIDDGVHNLIGGSYFKILMNSPNNSSYDAKSNGMIRVYNWKEAYFCACAYVQTCIKNGGL